MQPTLETARLVLRPFRIEDAKRVQTLAGHPLIAATTGTIPHPYLDGMAEVWIEQQGELFKSNEAHTFAICERGSDDIIGCINLFAISKTHNKAEIGYWLAVDYWNRGYITEVAHEIVRYGFENLELNKIHARYVSTNIASGKVMHKIGMKQEGHLREDVIKNGKTHDTILYALLRSEYRP